MTQQFLALGAQPGDGTGTPGRAGGALINANFTELYQNAYFFGADTGVANASVIASCLPQPATFTLTLGNIVRFAPADTNTGPATLNFLSSGAQPIVNLSGAPLVGAELQPANITSVEWNGTAWQILYVTNAALLSQIGSGVSYPQSPQELAAGVTPTNEQYETAPFHDVRRYAGWFGDGIHDDSAALKTLALVVAQGANGLVPPGPSYVATQVVFTVPSGTRSALWGYGVDLYTNNGTVANAIDGLQFTGGGNSDSLTVYGFTYYQQDAVATTGFNLNLAGLVTLVDCQVIISSTVAASGNFACARVVANGLGQGYWNKFIRFSCRQISGNLATYAPFGILLQGQANATVIRDGYFTSANYSIGLYADAGGNLPNAVVIDSNAFEGAVNAFIVNGVATISTSTISGLRLTNNRAESITQGFGLFSNLGADSAVPTYLSGNYLVSSCNGYLSFNGLQPTINSWDLSVTPSYSGKMGTVTNAGPFTFYNNNATLGDTAIFEVQNASATGCGWSMTLGTSTPLAQCRYRVGGAVTMNLAPTNSGYQVAGTQVVGLQQTTAVASAVFVAGSGTGVTSTSTFDGYTLEQVVKAMRIHGLLA